MNFSPELKELYSLSEQRIARAVFDQTWAMESGTEITPNLLQAMVRSGS